MNPRKKSEISVIADHYHINAFFGSTQDSGNNGFAFCKAWRISGWIIREVKEDDGFAAVLLGQQGIQQPFAVEAHVLREERVIHGFGLAADAEGQLVVLPVFVRINNGIPWLCEQIGNDAKPVGQRIRYDRIAEGLAFKRRILTQHLLPPYGAQLRLACWRRVAIEVFGTVGGEFILDHTKVHRQPVLRSDSDGGVILFSMSRCLCGLAQNPLFGKIDRFTETREHIVYMFIACLDAVIQLSSQWIHQFHPSGILLGYIR